MAASRSIRGGVPKGFRGGSASLCLNPGDGQVVMLAYVVEEVVNDCFVAAGLDRVVPNETNAVHTVSDKILVAEYREHVT